MNGKVIAFIGLFMLVSQLAFTAADDDDDYDGIVEEEADESVVVERMKYEPPKLQGRPFFAETFDDKSRYKKRWTQSQAKKDNTDENIAKYDGKWGHEEPKEGLEGDLGMILKSKAKHHAVSAKLDRPYEFKGKPFIVSYEVKFQNGMDCGGAYIKLLTKTEKTDLKAFHDKTPYTVMFGPDKCGMDHKLHFIFRHKNPKTGEFEEKHAKKPTATIDKFFSDKKTHLYSLVVNADNSFEVLVDNKVVNAGNLLEDMSPAVNPPKEIDDPNDKKPENWDEREKIPDPEAKKPEDWDEDQPEEMPDEDAVKPDGWLDDEEALIADPDADKPEDWDDEMDGEWEAPLIDNPICKDVPGCGEWVRPSIKNPLYKGKWSAPTIDNPNYQGEWKPKRIQNPDWFEDLEPYKMTPIDSLGLELWSMSDEIVFDNFLITDDKEIHASWVEQTWEKKVAAESASASGHGAFVQGILDVTKDRPWLWAVILVVIILPIVLLIVYCCMPTKEPEDIDAARKKTDEVTPDDEVQPEETEGAEAAAAADPGPAGDNSAKPKKSKAALEKEQEEATGEESTEGEADEEASQEEEDAEPKQEGKSEGKSEATRTSPRKRKTRKD